MNNQIQLIGDKLQVLRSLIPVFKGESAIWLANEIIKFELKRSELVNGNLSLTQPTNTMASVRNIHQPHTHQIIYQRAYWAPGQPVGAPVQNFRQIKYLPLPNSLFDLDQALSGALVDCVFDIDKQLIEFGGAAKVWITVQVRYEPAKPETDKREGFDQYLSAAPTRIFKRDVTIMATRNPYIDFMRILTERIKEYNAKFIRDKFGLRLAGIFQLILKLSKYQPLQGSGWQPLPEFLVKKKAILNIHNVDERCFGYSLLYFIDRPRNRNHLERAIYYTDEMFNRNNLNSLPYPISPNDVHLYEDKLLVNINVFTFFDDKGVARHPLVISRKNYSKVANLLYWKGHYAPIVNISRLFSDITKHKRLKHICLRCLAISQPVIYSLVTNNYVRATTSCRYYMCFRCQELNAPKLSSINLKIQQRHLLLYTLTSSQFLTLSIARCSTLQWSSTTKFALPQLFFARTYQTSISGRL